MDKLVAFWNVFFPDCLFYLLTAIVFVVGCVKCIRPISKSASALERAAELLEEGANAKLARPVWQDVKFLGKGLQPVWHGYLTSISAVGENAQACDVADYVNEGWPIWCRGSARRWAFWARSWVSRWACRAWI